MITADKRTPHTDALETLGLIHKYDEKRDAIHLGVEPVEAGERLRPGEHIGLVNGKAYNVEFYQPRLKALGIVDPFLETAVEAGQRFWLVVYPRKITSLRHVWEHPDFIQTGPIEPPKLKPLDVPTLPATTAAVTAAETVHSVDRISQAKKRLEKIACELDVEFSWLIENAQEAQESDWHYVTHPGDSGAFEGVYLPDDFWKNYAILKGLDPNSVESKNFFTCSC